MISRPGPTEVLEELGDKLVGAVSLSVTKTKRDQLQYRQAHPLFAAAHSARGWAGWIHDRLWDNFVPLVADLPNVVVRDKEPTREIIVGLKYRLRVKRHDVKGGVATYPTPTAQRFLRQEQQTIDGIQEVGLCVGYFWDNEERVIKEPVLSLPADLKHAAWFEILPPAEQDGTGGIHILRSPSQPGPVAPMIDFPGDDQVEDQQA